MNTFIERKNIKLKKYATKPIPTDYKKWRKEFYGNIKFLYEVQLAMKNHNDIWLHNSFRYYKIRCCMLLLAAPSKSFKAACEVALKKVLLSEAYTDHSLSIKVINLKE